MVNIVVQQPGQTRKRFHRRPNFPMTGTLRPFGLYPLMLHPVLPGETLKSGSSKLSVISMPLNNPLSGAWLETWLFYVKLTDIDRDLGQMFISDSYSTSGYVEATTNAPRFTRDGQIKWVAECMRAINNAFFINEGEAVVQFVSPDAWIYQIKLNQRSWYQNMMFEPAEVAVDTTGAMDMREQLSAYDMVQQMQMTELTYESYLEQYGVTSMREDRGDPEILRYTRSWTKPVNHIDPADGSPSSAWVWNDSMKIEKDKRFDEPGFLVQCAAVRPKMFQKGIEFPMIGEMWGFTDWFPAYNLADPTAGIRRIGTDADPFETDLNAAEGEVNLLYDYRDLLNHGEQFINDRVNFPYAIPFASDMATIAAATPQQVRGEYCTHDDIDNLFVGTAEKDVRCYYDGITGFTIAGHVQDTTL